MHEKQQTYGPTQGKKECQGQVKYKYIKMQGFLCLSKELTLILTCSGKTLRKKTQYTPLEDTVFSGNKSLFLNQGFLILEMNHCKNSIYNQEPY